MNSSTKSCDCKSTISVLTNFHHDKKPLINHTSAIFNDSHSISTSLLLAPILIRAKFAKNQDPKKEVRFS